MWRPCMQYTRMLAANASSHAYVKATADGRRNDSRFCPPVSTHFMWHLALAWDVFIVRVQVQKYFELRFLFSFY